jgi:patatin-like phospholipase/acyl hydrolase
MQNADHPARSLKHWKSTILSLLQSSRTHLRPRVLSLDGGGCRGYVTLHILKQLLRQVQPQGPIYPYLYFDLICGTSAGGLIAILLGVLHLDIDIAIEIYQRLTIEVFFKRFSVLRWLKEGVAYSSEPLRAAIDKILKDYGEGRTLMVDREKNKGCRVSHWIRT